MPAQVVVVKRSRRRAFEILRFVPGWLRAVFAMLRPESHAENRLTLDEFEVFRGTGLLAPERQSGLFVPELVDQQDLSDCRDCRICIEVCPSDVIELDFVQTSSGARIHFDFDPGRCIGCGDCARACPSNRFEMKLSDMRIGGGGSSKRRSLLQEPTHVQEI